MIFEILDAHLKALATPEQRTLILDTCDALAAIGDEEIEGIIDAIMENENEITEDLPFHLMEVVLKPHIAKVLLEFGITLDSNANLANTKVILNGIAALEDESLHEAVSSCLNADVSSEEILAEVLSIATSEPAITILETLDTVSPSLLDRLGEIVSLSEEIEETDYPDPELRQSCAARVKHYLKIIDSTFIADKIKEGYMCGLPFTTGLRTFKQELDSLLDSNPTKAIKAVVGLFLSSSSHIDEMDETITEWIHEYSEDIDQSAKWIGIYNNYKSLLTEQ